MRIVFRAIEESTPGERWASLFGRYWPSYRAWFLSEGDAARPSYMVARRALREYMPEIVPTFDALVSLSGGGDAVARFLSLYRPTPYLTGCSQAVWTHGTPLLVRNYDYSPRLWDGVLLASAWNGRRVMAMTDCLWGVLDGMNEAGLSVSLAFGGRKEVGDGFGIPLILRYILEFRESTDEAVADLVRIPCHMSYNVTVLDAAGRYATVLLAPDHPPVVTTRRVATNHQRADGWTRYVHATASVERESFLRLCMADPLETGERFTSRFLAPPLHSTQFALGWGTLYTAVYAPSERTATFLWPHASLTQTLAGFQEIALAIDFDAESKPGSVDL